VPEADESPVGLLPQGLIAAKRTHEQGGDGDDVMQEVSQGAVAMAMAVVPALQHLHKPNASRRRTRIHSKHRQEPCVFKVAVRFSDPWPTKSSLSGSKKVKGAPEPIWHVTVDCIKAISMAHGHHNHPYLSWAAQVYHWQDRVKVC
jgi:hypothetical protein